MPPVSAASSASGGAPGSARTIRPLPVRLPAAPPSRPVAVRMGAVPLEAAGMLTVTVSAVASESLAASRDQVAAVAEPAALPVKRTRLLLCPNGKDTPRALVSGYRKKSVLTAPPANWRGTSRTSPAYSARPSASRICAVSALSPSVAVASGTDRSTAVGSSSVSVTATGSMARAL